MHEFGKNLSSKFYIKEGKEEKDYVLMSLCSFLNALLANIILLTIQYLGYEKVRDEGLRKECRFFHAQEQSAFQT